MRNRLANCHNEYQGKRKRVLCVCSAGLLRSPTIAFVLINPPYNCNTRAVGTVDDYALIPIDPVHIEWANDIVCANHQTKLEVMVKAKEFESTLGKVNLKSKRIISLDIPDSFGAFDPELIKIINAKLKEINYKGTEL